MTKEEMIELAKQSGWEYAHGESGFEPLWAFAKLVAEKAIKEVLAPEQEPLAWISTGPARMIHWTSDKPAYGDDWVPLYTTPPQRTWVGLTEEEIDKTLRVYEQDYGWISFAKAIEAKLKLKNTRGQE